jgi:hypothetical protein
MVVHRIRCTSLPDHCALRSAMFCRTLVVNLVVHSMCELPCMFESQSVSSCLWFSGAKTVHFARQKKRDSLLCIESMHNLVQIFRIFYTNVSKKGRPQNNTQNVSLSSTGNFLACTHWNSPVLVLFFRLERRLCVVAFALTDTSKETSTGTRDKRLNR